MLWLTLNYQLVFFFSVDRFLEKKKEKSRILNLINMNNKYEQNTTVSGFVTDTQTIYHKTCSHASALVIEDKPIELSCTVLSRKYAPLFCKLA